MDANAQVDALYALNEQLRKMTSHLEHMSVSASRFAHNLDVMADLGQKIVHSHFLMDSLVERYGTGYDKSGGGGSPGIKGPDGLPGEPGKAGKGGRGGQGGDGYYDYRYWKRAEELNVDPHHAYWKTIDDLNRPAPSSFNLIDEHLQRIASGIQDHLFTYQPGDQRLNAKRMEELNNAFPDMSDFKYTYKQKFGQIANFSDIANVPQLIANRLPTQNPAEQLEYQKAILRKAHGLPSNFYNLIDAAFANNPLYQELQSQTSDRTGLEEIFNDIYKGKSSLKIDTLPDEILEFIKTKVVQPSITLTDDPRFANLPAALKAKTTDDLVDIVHDTTAWNNYNTANPGDTLSQQARDALKGTLNELIQLTFETISTASSTAFLFDIRPDDVNKLQKIASANNFDDPTSSSQGLLNTLRKLGFDFSKDSLSREDKTAIRQTYSELAGTQATLHLDVIDKLFARMKQVVQIQEGFDPLNSKLESVLNPDQMSKLGSHISGETKLDIGTTEAILDRVRDAKTTDKDGKPTALFSSQDLAQLQQVIEAAGKRTDKEKELKREQATEKEKEEATKSLDKFNKTKEAQSKQKEIETQSEKERKEKENNIFWDRLTNIAKKTVNFGSNIAGAASPDAMELLSGSFKLLAAQVGTTLIPSVVRLSYGLQSAASLFDRLPKSAKDTIGSIGGVGLTAAGLLVGGRALGLGALGSAAFAHPVAAGAIAATTALVGAGMYYSNSNYKDPVNGPPAFHLENTLFGKYKPGESSWNPFAWPMMREINNLNNRVDAARKPIIAGDLFQNEQNIPGMAVFNAKLNLEMYRKQEVPLLINKFAGNVQWEHIDKKISQAENEVNHYKERFKTTFAIKENYSGKNAELTSILESQREWTEKLEKLKAVKQYTLAEQSKDPKAMEKFAEIYFKNPSPEMKKKLKGDEELVGAAPLLMHFMQSTQPGYFSPEDLHKKIQLDAISDSPLAQELRRIAQDQLQKLVNNSEELNERIKNMGMMGLVFP